ncbi:MAG: M23 family metallopeptidase, partial [Clostridiales bacterium]|nr:M23 family metallopeptidase [Clostridiales bacterium]
SSSYGRYIIIDHGGNISTLYAHNSVLNVKKSDKAFQGQVIAASGNTGYSTGPHLHFEVRVNGVPQNPRNYVKF